MSKLGEILKDHYQYKSQLFQLAKSDLIKNYKGSALGWAWAVIKPAIIIFIYWFSFSVGLRVSNNVDGYPYFLWLISGLVPWFYMKSMLTDGIWSMRKYRFLVTNIKFPISVIPTFVSLSNLFVNLVLLGIVILTFSLFHFFPDIYYLQLIFFIALSFIFWTIWGLLGSLLSAMSLDFSNLIASISVAVLWLSGILWNPENISIGWVKTILEFNPVTYLINGFRNTFINKVWFFEQPRTLIYFCIVTSVLLMFTLWVYKRVRRDVADVL